MRLGFHLSISPSPLAIFERMAARGITCAQIFTHSPRMWSAKPLDEALMTAFRARWRASGHGPLVAHASYLLNLSAADDAARQRATEAFGDELSRAAAFGADHLVVHLGHHPDCESRIARMASSLTEAWRSATRAIAPTDPTTTAPEPTHPSPPIKARQGRWREDAKRTVTSRPSVADSPVALRETGVSRRHRGGNGAQSPIVGDGSRKLPHPDRVRSVSLPTVLLENAVRRYPERDDDLRELAAVAARLPFPCGFCLDTCHAFQVGHRLDTRSGRGRWWTSVRRILGEGTVKLIHLNDSVHPCGSARDHHAGIGLGRIGTAALAEMALEAAAAGVAIILETPGAGGADPTADRENLRRLSLAGTDAPGHRDDTAVEGRGRRQPRALGVGKGSGLG